MAETVTTVNVPAPSVGARRLSSAPLVARNTLYNLFSTLLLMLLALFCTPYIVHHLGDSAFGLFTLVGVVAGYFAMLDLGLAQAVVKYASEYYGRGETERLGRLIGTANVVYLGLGFFGSALIASLTGLLVRRVLHLEPAMLSDAYFALYLAAFGFFVNMPLSVFNALPTALQRMDITSTRNALLGMGNSLGAVALLAIGFHLRALLTLQVALSILGVLVFVIASRRLLPTVSFRLCFDREEARQLFHFAVPTAASSAGARAVMQLDRLLVGMFWPVAFVTYYTIPMDICNRGLSVTAHATRAMFPAVSDRSGRGDVEGVQRMYVRSTRLLSAVVLPLFVFCLLYAYPILTAWMGERIARASAPILTLAALAFCLQFLSALQNMFLTSTGHATLSAKWNLTQGATTVLLNLLLIPRYGAHGAAWSLLLASAGFSIPYTCMTARRVIRLSPARVLQPLLIPVLLAAVCFLPAYPLMQHVHRLSLLLLAFFVLGALYVSVGLLTRLLPREDFALVWSAFRRGGDPS